MGKMIKTTPKLCKSCKYSKYIDHTNSYCDYISMTYKSRNCEIGYCDKYEPREEVKNG